eukprot:1552233-Alexandrium_andersonii.AAC.1
MFRRSAAVSPSLASDSFSELAQGLSANKNNNRLSVFWTSRLLWALCRSSYAASAWGAITEVGGKVESDPGTDADPAPKPSEMVPFSWHSMSGQFWEEVAHSYNGLAVVHLTASDPIFPMTCIRGKKSYWGMCHTQEHLEALENEISNCIFAAMQNSKDAALYQQDLAKLLNVKDTPATTPKAAPDGGGAPKAAAKSKAKAKAKAEPLNTSSLLDKLKALDDNDGEDGED